MIVALTITKYRNTAIPFAFLGMAVLRLPLWLNSKCRFWKLLGCGKNAQVDLPPDFKHWALITTWESKQDFDAFERSSFVRKWFRVFAREEFIVLLKPLSSRGLWDGRQPFADEKSTDYNGKIAVITRASIRVNRIKEFQSNIQRAAESMRKSPGYILSAGIGEAPVFRQATFSVWNDLESMKNYAYKTFDHSDVIRLTRNRQWYSEELFARFAIIESKGILNGKTYEF